MFMNYPFGTSSLSNFLPMHINSPPTLMKHAAIGLLGGVRKLASVESKGTCSLRDGVALIKGSVLQAVPILEKKGLIMSVHHIESNDLVRL
ncbi:hypothetical protein SLEP1_g27397 [Rubroshorea leprosula]|uniref:Uncharacterized protein n=1 Tax=Rubroshorea leprosula TaxID=152421 RepID=A0AAV5JWS3_9ROSI|nr:hypothetical protein SLEP1_g27397 [Rubroshorea leprosula]